MAYLYVAHSKELSKWAADVGLTKQVYKVGLSQGTAEEAVGALNEAKFASVGDWRLLKKKDVEGLDDRAVIERLRRKDKMVDPGYYPRIKGAQGIFKIRVEEVTRQLLVRRVMEGVPDKEGKAKTGDIADYLIRAGGG